MKLKELIPSIVFEKRLARSRTATVLVPVLSFILAHTAMNNARFPFILFKKSCLTDFLL